jgi:hypothetical protein
MYNSLMHDVEYLCQHLDRDQVDTLELFPTHDRVCLA